MKILFVDTTTPDLVVAVVEEDKIYNVSQSAVGVRHSEMLCNKVDEVLRKANCSINDIDAYACAIGPGSFTGIRIGVSTLKGYCTAAKRPYIEVNCLQAIAVSDNCGSKGCAIIDAGNGYYFADYVSGVSPCLISYDDERVTDAGTAQSAVSYFDGAVKIIKQKYLDNDFDSTLTPLYIRRSQAEERK